MTSHLRRWTLTELLVLAAAAIVVGRALLREIAEAWP